MDNYFKVVFSQSLKPIVILVIGFLLGRRITRLEDRSIGAICLFAFAPAMLFRHGLSQIAFSHDFVFIFFFVLFHTVALLVIAHKVFQFLDISPRIHRLFLLNTVLVSLVGIRNLQPFLGDPAQAVQIVNMILFYQMVVLAILGIYLAQDESRSPEGVSSIFKSPLIYALGLGLILAIFQVELPYAVLNIVDSLYNVTVPLSLILVGVVLGKYVFLVEIRDYGVLLPGLILVAFFRLILSPCLAMLIAPLISMDNVLLQRILILSTSVPTGLFAGVLVSFYGKQNEKRFVMLCIIVTTLGHFLTLPILYKLLDRWFPIIGS